MERVNYVPKPNNTIENNSANGITIEEASDNALNGNIVCWNKPDIFSDNKSKYNKGDNNTCDTGNWNDTGTAGCTKPCEKQKKAKAQLGPVDGAVVGSPIALSADVYNDGDADLVACKVQFYEGMGSPPDDFDGDTDLQIGSVGCSVAPQDTETYTLEHTPNEPGEHWWGAMVYEGLAAVSDFVSDSFEVSSSLFICLWDISQDEEVDISDMVLVGVHFGDEGLCTCEDLEGFNVPQCDHDETFPCPWDVNDDEEVDISDLVLVGVHFGDEGQCTCEDLVGFNVPQC